MGRLGVVGVCEQSPGVAYVWNNGKGIANTLEGNGLRSGEVTGLEGKTATERKGNFQRQHSGLVQNTLKARIRAHLWVCLKNTMIIMVTYVKCQSCIPNDCASLQQPFCLLDGVSSLLLTWCSCHP